MQGYKTVSRIDISIYYKVGDELGNITQMFLSNIYKTTENACYI